MSLLKNVPNTLDFPSLRNQLKASRPCREEAHHFSVLIPIVNLKGQLYVLYEVRASHMKTQPNEVCFPGGKIECHENASAAAIRETVEELGLPESCIRLIAEIDKVVTPFNLVLHAFVAELAVENPTLENGKLYFDGPSGRLATQLNPDEVSEIFAVSLDWLLKNPPLVFTTTSKMTFPPDFPFHLIQNGENYNWRTSVHPILFYENEGPTIWGITARITQNLIDRLNDTD